MDIKQEIKDSIKAQDHPDTYLEGGKNFSYNDPLLHYIPQYFLTDRPLYGWRQKQYLEEAKEKSLQKVLITGINEIFDITAFWQHEGNKYDDMLIGTRIKFKCLEDKRTYLNYMPKTFRSEIWIFIKRLFRGEKK